MHFYALLLLFAVGIAAAQDSSYDASLVGRKAVVSFSSLSLHTLQRELMSAMRAPWRQKKANAELVSIIHERTSQIWHSNGFTLYAISNSLS